MRLIPDDVMEILLCFAALIVSGLCLAGAIVQIVRHNDDAAGFLLVAALAVAVPTMLFAKKKIEEGR